MPLLFFLQAACWEAAEGIFFLSLFPGSRHATLQISVGCHRMQEELLPRAADVHSDLIFPTEEHLWTKTNQDLSSCTELHVVISKTKQPEQTSVWRHSALTPAAFQGPTAEIVTAEIASLIRFRDEHERRGPCCFFIMYHLVPFFSKGTYLSCVILVRLNNTLLTLWLLTIVAAWGPLSALPLG